MTIFLAAIEVILSIALIAAILFQTTKSEGLSGFIGGHSSSILGGKSGTDLMLEKLTRYIAIAWLVVTPVLSWIYLHQ